jgi:hypothetical protein
MGREALFAKHPAARGYLRDPDGYRLYDRREELVEKLFGEVRKRAPKAKSRGRGRAAASNDRKRS